MTDTNLVATFENNLIAQLPPVRGTLEENGSLKKYTWFRTGGPAEVLFTPADLDDLMAFMREKPEKIPVTVLGLGSNVLVRDGGIAGVVLRLNKQFAVVNVRQENLLVGGGALDSAVAAAARDAGLSGLEYLSGIPGTIGGAVKMNAGAFEQVTEDVVVYARLVDNRGELHIRTPQDLGFGYRTTIIPEGWIVVGAMLKGERAERGKIAQKMEEIRAYREGSQPMRTQTGGSTFRNPNLSDSAGRSAWEVIDAAGCRGLKHGGAMISEKHCNFLINTGDASSRDIEDLGEMVRRRVLSSTGVSLEWEIRRIGRTLQDVKQDV